MTEIRPIGKTEARVTIDLSNLFTGLKELIVIVALPIIAYNSVSVARNFEKTIANQTEILKKLDSINMNLAIDGNEVRALRYDLKHSVQSEKPIAFKFPGYMPPLVEIDFERVLHEDVFTQTFDESIQNPNIVFDF